MPSDGESDAPTPAHIRTPHARPIQPIPVSKDGKQFVALRDPAMLVSQSMVVNPQALNLVQQFQGELDIDEIAAKFIPPEQIPDAQKHQERETCFDFVPRCDFLKNVLKPVRQLNYQG